MNVEMAIGKRITMVVTNVENEDDVHVYVGQPSERRAPDPDKAC